MPAAASSQTVLAGAHQREVTGAVGGAQAVEHGHEPVVRARDPFAQQLVVTLSRDVQDRRADGAERLDRELAQRACAGACARDEQRGALRG